MPCPPLVLWSDHLRKRHTTYLFAGLLVFGGVIAEFSTPKVIQWIVDSVGPSRSLPTRFTLSSLTLFLLLTLLIENLCLTFSRKFFIAQNAIANDFLKRSLWAKGRFLSEASHRDVGGPGYLVNLAGMEARNASLLFGSLPLTALFSGATLVAALVFQIFIDLQLCLICSTLWPFLYYGMKRTSASQKTLHLKASTSLSKVSEEVVVGLQVLPLRRFFSAESYFCERFSKLNYVYAARMWDARTNSLTSEWLGMGFGCLTSAVILIISLPRVLSGNLSVGQLLAFLTYSTFATGALGQLAPLISAWQRGRASLERLTGFFETKPEDRPDVKLKEEIPPARGGPLYQLKAVSFTIPGQSKVLLGGIDLEIPENGLIGVTGPPASGKSTLLRLMAGLETNFAGQLTIRKTPIRGLSEVGLRKSIGFVTQNPTIFSGTLRDNLAFSKKASDESLWKLLERVFLADEVRNFPLRLDTVLGESGVSLSGGQKQRLSVARVLGRAPLVFLIDDCLSPLDRSTAELLLQELKNISKTKTVILSAQADWVLSACDKIITLPAGVHENPSSDTEVRRNDG